MSTYYVVFELSFYLSYVFYLFVLMWVNREDKVMFFSSDPDSSTAISGSMSMMVCTVLTLVGLMYF